MYFIKPPFISSNTLLKTEKIVIEPIRRIQNKNIMYSFIPKLVCTLLLPECLKERMIKYTFETSGYVVLKFGQFLATKTEFLPGKMLKSLKSLCYNYEHQEQKVDCDDLLIENRDKRIYDVKFFTEFVIYKKLGSGSISTVYEGTYKNKPVAIKVIHNNIRNDILSELQSFEPFIKLISKFKFIRILNLYEFFLDFKNEIISQCDLRIEHLNNKILKKAYKDTIKIPEVYYSDKNTIITEIVVDSSNKNIDGFLAKIFNSRVFHLDLHPGNLKRINNGYVLIDSGICKIIPQKEYNNILDLCFSIFFKDKKYIQQALIKINEKNKVIRGNFYDEFLNLLTSDKGNYQIFKIISLLDKNNVKLNKYFMYLFNNLIYTNELFKAADLKSLQRKLIIDLINLRNINTFLCYKFKHLFNL